MNFCVRMVVVMSFVTFSCKGMQIDPVDSCLAGVQKAIEDGNEIDLHANLLELESVIKKSESGKISSQKWPHGQNILFRIFSSLRGGEQLLINPSINNSFRGVVEQLRENSGAAWDRLVREVTPSGELALTAFYKIFPLFATNECLKPLHDDFLWEPMNRAMISLVRDGALNKEMAKSVLFLIKNTDSQILCSLPVFFESILHALFFNLRVGIRSHDGLEMAYKDFIDNLKGKLTDQQWKGMLDHRNRWGETPKDILARVSDESVKRWALGLLERKMAVIDQVKQPKDKDSESPSATFSYSFQPKYSPGYLVGKILLGGGIVAVVGTTAFVAWNMFSADEKEKSA